MFRVKQPDSPRRRRGRRVVVLAVLCAAVFALFLARLAWMQFAMADHYAQKVAELSTTRYTVTEQAARGSILDRNGVVLAQDDTAFDVLLRVPAPDGTSLPKTVQQLSALTGGKDVETQLAAFCCTASAGEVPILQDTDAETVAALYRAGLVQSGAVRLAARGVRVWPQGTLLPHALGFTGAITAEQWQSAKAQGLAMDERLGQSGLEQAYDALLRGQCGRTVVSVDRSGTVTARRVLSAAQPGADLVLTVDAALQQALQDALADRIETLRAAAGNAQHKACAGAAVLVDVRSGGILAAANYPGYDLNTYRRDYADLCADTRAPLLDRCCQGLYAPGSAFKPAVAAAALQQGISPYDTVNCTGRYLYYSGYQPRCLQDRHSGPVDLRTALQYSCNIFFYDVGRRLGMDVFSKTAQQLGLAADVGVETPAAAGQLTWSSDENYQAGLTLMAAIGQGNTALTPVQLAAYAAALANGGRRPLLHFADRAVDVDGATVWQYTPQFVEAAGGEAVFGPIRDGMVRMAQGSSVLRQILVPCAAKTSSPQLPAQMAGGGHYVNSVLIGYAPAQAPEIALAVVLEYGGGGFNAAPIMRDVFNLYFGG